MNEAIVGALFPEALRNVARGACAICAGVMGPFRDALSEKEAGISGMCQACQDNIFGGA